MTTAKFWNAAMWLMKIPFEYSPFGTSTTNANAAPIGLSTPIVPDPARNCPASHHRLRNMDNGCDGCSSIPTTIATIPPIPSLTGWPARYP